MSLHNTSGPDPRISLRPSDPCRTFAGMATAIANPAKTARGVQPSFDDLGTPLRRVEFVVVDLETTGGSATDCHITEIGALRVCGGVVSGEFATLVNPGVEVPPFIAALTGITTSALADAPRLAAALPSWLEFARGSVLVAHNAGFDTGFLKAGCRRLDLTWPQFPVVDTVRLARALLTRDDVPNYRLGTLAKYFRSGTEPIHRALSDARATADVLHSLLERAGNLGVHDLEDLFQICSPVSPAQRQKRTLADGLPESPGVYVFQDLRGNALYIGKSKSMRKRVRSYFTAAERRKRMDEMIRIATRVKAIPCATPLEAAVREVRLIAEHRPPYNRRSRSPEKAVWLKLTDEPFPRLSLVTKVSRESRERIGYAGPFPSRRAAEEARDAFLVAVPLRACRTRLALRQRSSACVAAELGHCVAPCADLDAKASYAALVKRARSVLHVDAEPIVSALAGRMRDHVAREEFEEAAAWRDRLRGLLAGIDRMQQATMLAACPEVVAARADGREWEIHVIRHGRLAGAARCDARTDPRAVVEAAIACAECVVPSDAGICAGLPEEGALLLNWLSQEGVRLVRLSGELALPRRAAAAHLAGLSRPVRSTHPDPGMAQGRAVSTS